MSDEWAVRLPISKMMSAASLRLRPDIGVAQADEFFWLRGKGLDEELVLELRKLPGAERFELGDDGSLRRQGSRLPVGTLPDTQWTPLSAWLVLEPQPAALPGNIERRVKLQLARTSNETPASVLLTSQEHWLAYAVSAPEVRLQPLQFAVDYAGRTLVRGRPLPPIPGQQFIEQEGIAIPCGFAPAPAVDAATIRSLLGISSQELALFCEDGSVEIIPGKEFVPATRANARATAAEFIQSRTLSGCVTESAENIET